jgi:hypothetical protein
VTSEKIDEGDRSFNQTFDGNVSLLSYIVGLHRNRPPSVDPPKEPIMRTSLFVTFALLTLTACGGADFSSNAPILPLDPLLDAGNDALREKPNKDAGAQEAAIVTDAPFAPDSLPAPDAQHDAPLTCASGWTGAVELTGTGVAGGYGIFFHSPGDAILAGFTFTGSGLPDTIRLVDASCHEIVSVPANGSGNVQWALAAGTKYGLVNTTAGNTASMFQPPSYPFTDPGNGLVVDGVAFCGNPANAPSGGWDNFEGLTVCH